MRLDPHEDIGGKRPWQAMFCQRNNEARMRPLDNVSGDVVGYDFWVCRKVRLDDAAPGEMDSIDEVVSTLG